MATTAQYGVALYGDSYYDLLLLNCDGGSYTITSGDASLLYSHAIQAEVGSYSITGQQATLDYDQLLNCEAGSFELTGNSATFVYDQTIYAGAFSFIWSGQQAGLLKDAVLDAETGAYSLTGGSATFVRSILFDCNGASYSISGKAATLNYNTTPIIIVESKGGIGKKKKSKLTQEKESREELEAIVKREFDILDGTYQPEVVEVVKETVLPKIQEIDYTKYQIALAQVNALLLQAKIKAAEYEAELDDEEALLMLL